MQLSLDGRTALVPGSTSGIGRAVAETLGAAGARVVVAGRRAELVDEVSAGIPDARGVVADISETEGTDAVLAAAAEVGDVDVLVLNGGGPPPAPASDLADVDTAEAVRLLLAPHVRLVQAVVPGMRERGWGRVVAIGSSGVQEPIPYLAGSNVGRAALAGYLKTLAAEVAADGVTVNMVLPGRIDTARVEALDGATGKRQGTSAEQARADAIARIPAGRYGRPEELAAVVAFLASEGGSYVTGEQIRCDGGMVSAY